MVSPEFGKWTVAVDDVPWGRLFGEMVLTPHFSPNGVRVAAAVKHAGRWTIVVDGVPMPVDFEMVWEPVFSPCGSHVLAKAESQGKYLVLIDGKMGRERYDALWEPIISPDSRYVLLRFIKGDEYCREVAPLAELLR